MMDTQHIVDMQLAGYIDDELGATERATVDQHLAECAQCRQALARQETAHALLRQHAAETTMPDGLAARLLTGLPDRPAPARTTPTLAWWRKPWVGLSLAGAGGTLASAMLAVLLVLPAIHDQTALIGDDILTSHVRSLQPGHLMDVISTDQHTVKPWFAGKVSFSPPVLELADAGFPLAGGRMDYLARQEVAALVYRYKLHVINLYIWPADGHPDTPVTQQSQRGYQLVHWQQNGMVFWAVSDANAAVLTTFAKQIRERASVKTAS